MQPDSSMARLFASPKTYSAKGLLAPGCLDQHLAVVRVGPQAGVQESEEAVLQAEASVAQRCPGTLLRRQHGQLLILCRRASAQEVEKEIQGVVAKNSLQTDFVCRQSGYVSSTLPVLSAVPASRLLLFADVRCRSSGRRRPATVRLPLLGHAPARARTLLRCGALGDFLHALSNVWTDNDLYLYTIL